MSGKLKGELQSLAASLDRAAREAEVSPEVEGLAPSATPDEPISSAAEDRLNRSGFAAELARAVLQLDSPESIVVGIHGKWGTGKSSLLNLVEEKLQGISEGPPIIFRFNPWGFSDQQQLLSRFFADLAAFLKLHATVPPLAKISDAVEEYGSLLSPAARAAFPRATEFARVAWNLYRKVQPARLRAAPELKAKISSALTESGAKLIIMVDDVDRLNATEIRQAFQLIKLNANFSNTVYLVAFDKDPVMKALEDVAPGPPEEYLEKIVQVSFSLPPIHEGKLTEIILDGFNGMLASAGISNLDQQRFGNMFYSGFRASFRTIRDVKRYFNVLGFALNLVLKDTNFIDLAAVQALALFYPTVYRSIQGRPDLFTGGWTERERAKDKDSLRAEYDRIFSQVPGPRRKSVVELCEFLFPKAQRWQGQLNLSYTSEWEQSWRRERRIASPRHFTYYFELAVPETDVSQSELDEAVDSAKSTTAFVESLRRFKETKRFGAFIEALRDQLPDLGPDHLRVILESVFVFGDEVETEGPAVFGLISEHIQFAMWLLLDILERMGERRFETLRDAMEKGSATFTITETTAICARMLERNDGAAQFAAKYPDLTEEIVLGLKQTALRAIEKAKAEGRLRSVPRLGAVLYRWRQWGGGEEVGNWVSSTFLQNTKGAALFVASFARTVSQMGLADRTPKTYLTVPVREIKEFADLDTLASLLQSAEDADLTDRERLARTRFLSAKAKLDSGQDPDASFPLEDDP